MARLSQELQGIADRLAKLVCHLDEGGEECSCCGTFRYRNFNDRQSAEAIRGAVGRIERTAKRLEKEGR